MSIASIQAGGEQLDKISQRILQQMGDREERTVPQLDDEIIVEKRHSREAIRYRLKKLERAGLVIRMAEKEQNKGSRKDSPVYWITDRGIDLLRAKGSEMSAPADLERIIEQVQENMEAIESLERTVRDNYSTRFSRQSGRIDDLEEQVDGLSVSKLQSARADAKMAREDVRELRDELNAITAKIENKAIRARSSATDAQSAIAVIEDDVSSLANRLDEVDETLNDIGCRINDSNDSSRWWPF